MKNIKIVMLLTLLMLSTSTFSQSKASLFTKTNSFKSFNFDSKVDDYMLNFKSLNFSKSNLFFSSYNETIKLNDIYLLNNNNNFIYSKSSLILKNNFRGNKIDSYNPYGTSNIGSALIFGLVGLIVK